MGRRLPKNPTAIHCRPDRRHLFGTTVTPLRPNLPRSRPRLYLQASQCVRGTCVAAHEVRTTGGPRRGTEAPDTGGRHIVAKEDRGFASMDRSKQREIASKGGKAAHQKGTAHEWTSEEARDAGRKGGIASHRRRREQSGGPESEDSRPGGMVDPRPSRDDDQPHGPVE